MEIKAAETHSRIGDFTNSSTLAVIAVDAAYYNS